MKTYHCDRCKTSISAEPCDVTFKKPQGIVLTKDLCTECYWELRVFFGDYQKIKVGHYEKLEKWK